MLELSFVQEIIENGVSPKIQKAREYAKELNTHVTGRGVDDVLETLESYENEHQKSIRKKIVKSNKGVFSFLCRPIDKVFTAKGGSINYNLSNNQLENLKSDIKEINDGLSLKEFLKKKIKQHYTIDPNGFVMIDVDSEGGITVPFYKSENVIWYDNKGNNIKSVVFDFFEGGEDDGKKYYRVVDELTDSIYVQDGDNIYQDEDSIKENFWGYVPAYIVGDIYSVNEPLFLSVFDEVLEDAKSLLRDVSVNTVHKLSHGYAKYWQYPEDCVDCGGSGSLKKNTKNSEGETVCTDTECPSCQGGGKKKKKTASDLMIIPIPDDDGKVLAPDVGGYINPSIEIWRQYNEDIKDCTQSMFQRVWGSTFSIESSNETATGRLLNVQPEAERVSGISNTFSRIHKFLLDGLIQVLLQKTDHETSVDYGTRYLIESPDEILKTYGEAVDKNLHSSVKSFLLDRFYQTEHCNSPDEYAKIKKLVSVDPFPNYDISDLREIGVSQDDLKEKIYYPQWMNSLDETKKILMTVEELKTDLKQFVNKKTLTNETTGLQQEN